MDLITDKSGFFKAFHEMKKENSEFSFTSIPFYFKLSYKPGFLFNCMLGFLAGTGILLPLIHIPVIINSRGIIRPENDISEIISPISGIVENCFIQEGKYINKHDTLLIFKTQWFDKELEILNGRKVSAEKHICDIRKIMNGDTQFCTERYKTEYATYNLMVEEKRSRENQIFKNLNRMIPLWRDSLISSKEFEDMEFQLMLARNETRTCISSHLTNWAGELEKQKNDLHLINERLIQIKENLSRSVITSPVNGMVHKMNGLAQNSFVSQHQKIIIITPDTRYSAEIYIKPADIGWIKPGIKGRILLDSFDSSYWGALETECYYISDDIHWVNDQPFYLARCKIESNEIVSGKGLHALVKKGMTLTIQFIITERSILQLLTDNFNNWFDPAKGVK